MRWPAAQKALLRDLLYRIADGSLRPPAPHERPLDDAGAVLRDLERLQGEPRAQQGQQPGQPANPRLLPDISAVGDIVFDLSPDGSTQEDVSRLGVREVEVALQAVVDPYFRGDIFLGVSDLEGIAIEQAYLTTTSLPQQIEARLGRFMLPFGKQNTTHRHDLHTIEYQYVIQRFFSTSSRCTTASTPPKPCRARMVKEKKRSESDLGCGRCSGKRESRTHG